MDETRHLYYTEPSKWQVIEERVDASSDAERQFVWGLRYIDDLVLRDRDTTGDATLDERLYSLQDANWNVTSIANTTGAIQERYTYSAYGVPMFLDASFNSRASSSYDWETLYAGYRWDAVVQICHVRYRILLVHMATWGQRDPLGLSAGMNLYEYVSANPIGLIDPTGEIFFTFIAIAVVGAILLAPTPVGAPGPGESVPPGGPNAALGTMCCVIIGTMVAPTLLGPATIGVSGSLTLPLGSVAVGTHVFVLGGLAYSCTNISGHDPPIYFDPPWPTFGGLCEFYLAWCLWGTHPDNTNKGFIWGLWGGNSTDCSQCYQSCLATGGWPFLAGGAGCLPNGQNPGPQWGSGVWPTWPF